MPCPTRSSICFRPGRRPILPSRLMCSSFSPPWLVFCRNHARKEEHDRLVRREGLRSPTVRNAFREGIQEWVICIGLVELSTHHGTDNTNAAYVSQAVPRTLSTR